MSICGGRYLDALAGWIHSSMLSLHVRGVVLQPAPCSCTGGQHRLLLFLNSINYVFNIRVFSLVSMRSLSSVFLSPDCNKSCCCFLCAFLGQLLSSDLSPLLQAINTSAFILGLSFSGFPFLGSEVTQNQHFPAEAMLVFDKTPATPLPSSSHSLCVSSLAQFLLGKLNVTSSLLTKSALPGSVTTSW